MTDLKLTFDDAADGNTQEQQYDAFDRLARRIGAAAATGTRTWRELNGDDYQGSYYLATETGAHPVGTVEYFYSPFALRDGKHYGASHGYKTFATKAERDAAVAKYFLGAMKRALKANVKKEV